MGALALSSRESKKEVARSFSKAIVTSSQAASSEALRERARQLQAGIDATDLVRSSEIDGHGFLPG